MIGEIVKQLILSASGATVGIGVYVALRHASSFVRTRKIESLHMAILRFSESVIIGLIAEAVYHSPTIPPEWRSWLYTLALFGCFDGFLYVARHRDFS